MHQVLTPPDSLEALREAFTGHEKRIVNAARKRFRLLKPEALEEAVQETRCVAWEMYQAYAERGDAPDKVIGTIAYFAALHVAEGRNRSGRSGRWPCT